MRKSNIFRGGFALPTVLIASVVMLTVLAVAVTSVATVRTTLKTQYYEQLAKAAGEAGVAYAKACLAKNSNQPLWTDAKPLRPSTDCAGNELLSPSVQVLIVAGGGGGGEGGGGGGGVIYEETVDVVAQNYPIVVGGGGAGSSNGVAVPGNGGNSSAFGLTAIGGGAGAVMAVPGNNGANGGSGGGGRRDGGGGGGSGTPGQGHNGGATVYQEGVFWKGGSGGGGAGGPGANGSGNNVPANERAGNGGPGFASQITGALVYYGGGGGGGVEGSGGPSHQAMGGNGGGGRGYSNQGGAAAATSGLPNSGGGGGGRPATSGSGSAGSGGSGVVIIRYGNTGSVEATGGTVTTSGPYKIHRFTGNGTFTVNGASTSSCPSDPRCSVVSNDELRSSFSIPRPVLDGDGRAVTIANTGYVDLLRSSTGGVWRTYKQPSVQAAVVPDLCSGAAISGLGWQNAVISSTPLSVPNASAAQPITVTDTDLPAGKSYYRKDFTVTEAGSYNLAAVTPGSSDIVQLYVDGQLRGTSNGALINESITLDAGCHTITAELTSKTLLPKKTRFTAAIQRTGAAPIVATDATWRVSTGSSVHFSQSDYYADDASWTPVIDYQNPTAQLANSAWQNTQGDVFTRMIIPTGAGCAATCAANSSAYMRDDEDFILTESREVQVSALCDDDCNVFIDGEMVIANSPWSSINQQTLTLTPGPHRVAVRVYNSGAGPSAAGVSVVDRATGVVYTRTDRSWQGAIERTTGNGSTDAIRSYEASFVPSPDDVARPVTLDYVVVGGGGGGGSNAAGGGGAGGVAAAYGAQFPVGTHTVTVGAGGVMGTNSGTGTDARGQNGGQSRFGSVIVNGGGGGASRDNGPAASSGGSGGGGAGSTVTPRNNAGAGTNGQGYSGGSGTTPDQGAASKGGGGGGAGGSGVVATTTVAGNGGAGFISYITGTRLGVAGGGGGSITAGNGYQGAATDGGVAGGVSGTNAGANTGGGGGGSSGAGGSGVVIIRVKTGSMEITTTGTPTITSANIGGIDYTIYRFNASGTFRIVSIN